MNRLPNPLIDQLADELTPVKPVSLRAGLGWALAAFVLTLGLVVMRNGVWLGMFAGEANALFWITMGLMALLAVASSASVARLAAPGVGNRHEAPWWAFTALLVLPLTAVAGWLSGSPESALRLDAHGLSCARQAFGFSMIAGAIMVIWLRRGAPVSLPTAGFHVGMGAGAIGAVAFGVSCSLDGLAHLGFWHVSPVLLCAALGRLIVPTLVRW